MGRTEVLRVVEAEFNRGSRVDVCSTLTKLLMQIREQKDSCRDYDLLSHVRKIQACLLELLWDSIVIIKAEGCLC